jgi:hypothetical protein
MPRGGHSDRSAQSSHLSAASLPGSDRGFRTRRRRRRADSSDRGKAEESHGDAGRGHVRRFEFALGVVYDNGKPGFVDIEQKAAGLVPVYTDLKNPDFGEVAKAMGLWGHSISKAGELEKSVQAWLVQPGPALLHVKVTPMQLVMPPSPLIAPEAVVGMGVYTALQAKRRDVWEMMVENVP